MEPYSSSFEKNKSRAEWAAVPDRGRRRRHPGGRWPSASSPRRGRRPTTCWRRDRGRRWPTVRRRAASPARRVPSRWRRWRPSRGREPIPPVSIMNTTSSLLHLGCRSVPGFVPHDRVLAGGILQNWANRSSRTYFSTGGTPPDSQRLTISHPPCLYWPLGHHIDNWYLQPVQHFLRSKFSKQWLVGDPDGWPCSHWLRGRLCDHWY